MRTQAADASTASLQFHNESFGSLGFLRGQRLIKCWPSTFERSFELKKTNKHCSRVPLNPRRGGVPAEKETSWTAGPASEERAPHRDEEELLRRTSEDWFSARSDHPMAIMASGSGGGAWAC